MHFKTAGFEAFRKLFGDSMPKDELNKLYMYKLVFTHKHDSQIVMRLLLNEPVNYQHLFEALLLCLELKVPAWHWVETLVETYFVHSVRKAD